MMMMSNQQLDDTGIASQQLELLRIYPTAPDSRHSGNESVGAAQPVSPFFFSISSYGRGGQKKEGFLQPNRAGFRHTAPIMYYSHSSNYTMWL